MMLLYRRKSDFSSEGESCKGTCRGGGGYYGEEEGDHFISRITMISFCSVLGFLFFFFFFFGVAVGGEW